MKIKKKTNKILAAIFATSLCSTASAENDIKVLVSYEPGKLPQEFVHQTKELYRYGTKVYGTLNLSKEQLTSLLAVSYQSGSDLQVELDNEYRFPKLLNHTIQSSDEITDWQSLVKLNQLSVRPVSSSKVCLIDSGVQIDSPGLNQKLFSGLSSEYAGHWYQDSIGHGTHLAGIISGYDQSTPAVEVLVRKVLKTAGGENRTIRNSDLISAIEQCANDGADVINLSLSSPYFSEATRDVIDRLTYDRGIIFVAAAGNHGQSNTSNDYLAFPAAYRNVLAIGATNKDNSIADFSAKNMSVDLVAPGVEIKSSFIHNQKRVTAVKGKQGRTLHFVQVDHNANTYPSSLYLNETCLVDLPNELLTSKDSTDVKAWFTQTTSLCEQSHGEGVVYTYDASYAQQLLSGIDIETQFPTLLIPNLARLDYLNTHLKIETIDSEQVALSGTSQATAIVSAGIAHLKSIYPSADRNEILNALYSSAIDLGQPGKDSFYGRGLVNFFEAEKYLSGEHDVHEETDCPDPWYGNKAYKQGEKVSLGRFTFEANYWSQDENPFFADGLYEAWQSTGECEVNSREFGDTFNEYTPRFNYLLEKMERIEVVYKCKSYSLACGGGGNGFSGVIIWGGGGSYGGGFSDGGGGGGAPSSTNNNQKSKEEKQFAEDAADITNAITQFQAKLKQILNGLDRNSSAYKQVNNMYQKLGKLADRLNSGMQGFNHAWNGEGQKAMAEALAFVVAGATGKTVDAAGRLLGKNPVVAIGKAAASVGASLYTGGKAEAAFEKFIFDTYVKDVMSAASYYQRLADRAGSIMNDMRCGYRSGFSRPDMLCEDLKSNTYGYGSYIVTLALQNSYLYQSNHLVNSVLFIDFNESGRLDHSKEVIFGYQGTQLDPLILLDSNNDLILDANDENFKRLMIWSDYNGNNHVDDGESQSAVSLNLSLRLASKSKKVEASLGNRPVVIEITNQ